MFGILKNSKSYVLAANDSDVILADIKLKKGGESRIELLASQQREVNASLGVAQLLAGLGREKANVALVLPLSEFEIASVSVPPVSREGVNKMLPYTLSKVLDKPVNDYIYDWQIAQTFKDRHELTVFLYPAATYEAYRRDLVLHHKEIASFEPDVFAACSYLTDVGVALANSIFLCVLVYQSSVSIAVYENKRISLLRSVDMELPELLSEGFLHEDIKTTQAAPKENMAAKDSPHSDEAITMEYFDSHNPEETETSTATGTEDVLAGFGLPGMDQGFVTEKEQPIQNNRQDVEVDVVTLEDDPWGDYIEGLNLEIMRTGDYHTSVLKGKAIKKFFLGADNQVFDILGEGVGKNQNVPVERFPPQNIEIECSQMLAAISIGTLTR